MIQCDMIWYDTIYYLKLSYPDQSVICIQPYCRDINLHRRANHLIPGFGRFKHTFKASVEEFFSPKLLPVLSFSFLLVALSLAVTGDLQSLPFSFLYFFFSFLLFCFLYLFLINCFAICLVHYFWTFLLISLPSSTFLCFFKNLLHHSFIISSSYIFISASLYFEIYQACFIILISHQCNSDFCISNMMRIIDSTLFL